MELSKVANLLEHNGYRIVLFKDNNKEVYYKKNKFSNISFVFRHGRFKCIHLRNRCIGNHVGKINWFINMLFWLSIKPYYRKHYNPDKIVDDITNNYNELKRNNYYWNDLDFRRDYKIFNNELRVFIKRNKKYFVE